MMTIRMKNLVLGITLGLFCLSSAFELYSPTSQMCCGGKVVSGELRVSMCCGDSVFDPTAQKCCNGKILELPEEAENDTLPPLIPSPSFNPHIPVLFSARSLRYGCCEESIFDGDKQICCNGKVKDKPLDKKDSNDTSAPPPFYSCCGDELFVLGKEDCCRGKVMRKTKDSEGCCGDQLIDYAKQVCCTDDFANETEIPVVFDRDDPDVSCCGRSKINFKNQICCNGKVLPLSKDMEERSRTSCCGEELWVESPTQTCCNGKVMPRKSPLEHCCGSKFFNLETELCCMDVVSSRNTTDTFCCGNVAYDSATDTCCYGSGHSAPSVVPLGNDPDASACCGEV